MRRSSSVPRRGVAVLAGLLLLLCGAVFAVSASSSASAAPSGAPHVSRAAASASYDEPGDTVPGNPGCQKQKKGDADGAVPAPSSGAQNLALALSACLVPESHIAIGAAHARPPVRGPTPMPPPTPVELSVLRV